MSEKQLNYTRAICYLCGWMVICPTCGNNSCNGTYGKMADGSWCLDCPRAYDLMLSDDLMMALPEYE